MQGQVGEKGQVGGQGIKGDKGQVGPSGAPGNRGNDGGPVSAKTTYQRRVVLRCKS